MEDKDVEVLEEKKSKRKSVNTVGVIFVALLLVGLSVACGWFANSYFNNLNKKPNEASNTEKKDEKNDEKEPTRTVTEEEAFNLFNLFLDDATYDEINPGGIDLMEEYDNKSLITIKDLGNNLKFNIIRKSLKGSDIITLNSDGGYYNMGQTQIFVDTLKKYSLLYFNEEIPLPNEFFFFASDCKLNNSKYICDSIPTGGNIHDGWIYIPTTYKVESNILQIDGIAVYDSVGAYCVDKSCSKSYCDYSYSQDLKICLKENAQYFNKVSMKFDLSNDKYLFVSIEK